jgi:hypothetical protein
VKQLSGKALAKIVERQGWKLALLRANFVSANNPISYAIFLVMRAYSLRATI